MSELRTKLFAMKDKLKTVSVDLGGTTVEIREPTGSKRAQLAKLAKKAEEDGGLDAQCQMIIDSVYDPETGNPVFDKADIGELREFPASVLDALSKPLIEMMNVTVEAAAKN